MAAELAHAIGASLALWIVLMIVVSLTFGLAMPLMAFSAMRNLKRIRIALEQIADVAPSQRSGSGANPLRL